MRSCNRFETEGLIILQKGGQLDEHFSTCQSCVDAKQKYAALEQFIKAADSTTKPAEGWQQQVLESVGKPNKVEQSFWLKGIAAGFATIMVIGLLVNQFSSHTPPPGSLEIMIASSDQVYRGTATNNEAKTGDFMELTAYPQNLGSLQIRVYRDGQLYDSCGATQPCRLNKRTASLRVEMKSQGEYTTLMTESNKEIIFIKNNLDLDVLLAHDLSAEVTVSDSINVR